MRDQSDNMIARKSEHDIRVLLFNVNGLKTLFNYHPWNTYKNNLNSIFTELQGDIISLQELKLSNISNFNFDLANYRCFVTLPKFKKGYSGVGLFIRIPADHEDTLIHKNLSILKVEEGLTGYLLINGVKIRDLHDETKQIGAYPDIEESLALKLDSEGRCVIAELASNLVIFSLYCPANSIGTEEGEAFKMKFMEILINRCEALYKSGKQIMVIGDINITLDLIDQAEGINVRFKKKLVELSKDGNTFELKNLHQCFNFKFENKCRAHLNKYVVPTIGDYKEVKYSTQFLYDTTRIKQGRKLGIYTVWNTLTNSRQTNYGSRIDLILTTKDWLQCVTNANICASLLGSDHCPVFTDFSLQNVENDLKILKSLDFDIKNYYKLVKHRDISTMFKPIKRKTEEGPDKVNEVTTYKSRKKDLQPSIRNFFKSKQEFDSQFKIEAALPLTDSCQIDAKLPPKEITDWKNKINFAYGKPPKCLHNLPCQLKTSLKKSSRGRKYWCCPNTEVNNQEKCDYFSWLTLNNL